MFFRVIRQCLLKCNILMGERKFILHVQSSLKEKFSKGKEKSNSSFKQKIQKNLLEHKMNLTFVSKI